MAVPSGVDPHEVLGVATGAAPADVTAAYRRLAKRWHPDRAPSAEAADRMALINAAYAALRTDGEASRRRGPSPAPPRATPDGGTPSWPAPGSGPPSPPPDHDDPLRRRAVAGEDALGAAGAPEGAGPGGWAAGVFAAERPSPAARNDGLSAAVRRALGTELRSTLQPGEEVGIVVPATTWASPQTTLAVTDRRVLWLLDDAPVHRVRSMLLSDVADVRVRGPRLWRPGAQVVCTDRRGRRTTFGELPPATADAVARRVRA